MLGRARHEFSSRFLAAALLPVLLGIAFLAPGAAQAAEAESLTPELATLATPEVASGTAEEQAQALGLPAEGPGSLSREGERVVVEAHFESGAIARLGALEEAGAEVLVASREYQTVALAVEPEDLSELAEVPGLEVVAPSLRPIVYAAEGAAPAAGGSENCEGGSVISKGVEQLNVPAAREAFGVDGEGVTVGVLSNSFDKATKSLEGTTIASHARQDEESNDLPGPHGSCAGQHTQVDVIAEAPTPAAGEAELDDEGRAMLQVVHDVAPQADLAFATAYSSELEFAANIEELAAPVSEGGAGASVIVDDVAYYAEPFFQEGPVGNAIQRVTEEGVTYLTAGGNNNLIESPSGREIASWERVKFHDATCPSSLLTISKVREAASSCMNFSSSSQSPDSTFGITVSAGSALTVDLQWAEPWYGVEADLNAYLLNAAGEKLVNKTMKNVGAGALREPFEYLTWTNETGSATEVQLVIDRCIHNCNTAANVAAMPRLKVALMQNGGGVTKTQYPESDPSAGIIVGPTVFGHAGSAAAITLGAVKATQSATAPKEPEKYSSRGPVVHYFGPYAGTTPAAKLLAREVIEKPNLVATDCGATTFFAQQSAGQWVFCGTSEAAPHAAGVAALMKERITDASPQGIRESMEASTTAFTVVDECEAVGSGMLNADGALATLETARNEEEGSGGPVGSAAGIDCESELGPEEETEERTGEEGGGSGSEENEKVTEGEKTSPPEKILTPTPEPKVAPTVKVISGPPTIGNVSTPTFEFSASHPAVFTCQLDGGTAAPCTSPYTIPAALSDGPHGFVVTARDSEGLVGSSPVYEFTVDTKAPRARIVGHPKKLVTVGKGDYRAKFRLSANASPVTYYCQIDREPLRICGSSPSYKVAPGRHVLKVRVKDELGNLSITPSTFHFRVKELPR
jgi:hypothetical protein